MYALEQADIQVPGFGGGKAGGIDVGEMNGRSDRVGRVKEAELWRKARALVEDPGGAEGVQEGRGEVHVKEEEGMDVDVVERGTE